jgi:hypothetical protein
MEEKKAVLFGRKNQSVTVVTVYSGSYEQNKGKIYLLYLWG